MTHLNSIPLQPGHRIIYNGQYVGTLLERTNDENPHWRVEWDDGAENNTVYPEEMMVHLNGGPSSAQYTQRVVMIPDADLREFPGEGPKFPDDTFVESADGSVWRVEPDFGWDCVSSGSAVLMGPARLLVMGGQE